MENTQSIKPFLRWAGGKSWLIPRLKELLPADFRSYHEPFLGSGAIYFSACNGNRAFLSDSNPDLINAFVQIRDNCSKVIQYLRQYQNTEDNYYAIRARTERGQIKRAAQFIFLNRTCYNGVYRVNMQGKFNVPYCHNPNALIYKKDHLRSVVRKLRTATIQTHDFECISDNVKKNDLVFLDPPYTVGHDNNGFLEYNTKLFSWADQERLASLVDYLNSKGAYYIVTNAAHESIKKLYKNLGNRFEIERTSTITSIISKRSLTTEYLFTNCI